MRYINLHLHYIYRLFRSGGHARLRDSLLLAVHLEMTVYYYYYLKQFRKSHNCKYLHLCF